MYMKKILRFVLLLLGSLLLLSAAAMVPLMTALKPLTIEAGESLPEPAAFSRFPFLTFALDGEVAPQIADTSVPGEYEITLRVMGIPYQTVLTISDTVSPAVEAVARSCFLGEELEIGDFVRVKDVTQTTLSYVFPPDFSLPGEQIVEICAVDLGGNQTLAEVPLTVWGISLDVTVEAGTSPEDVFAQIVDAVAGDVIWEDAAEQFDLHQPGEQDVPFLLDGREVVMHLTVVDTVAPHATVQMVSVLRGGSAEPTDFLRSIHDMTDVTVSFAELPDFSNPGLKTVHLRLTDAAGNVTELSASARVYAAPAVCTLEMGTFTPESLREFLLCGEKLTLDDTQIAHPTPGEVKLSLITPRGEELMQTVIFTDSYPPVGRPQNRTVYFGETLEARAFVAYAADSTSLTMTYTDGNIPDFEEVGAHSVSVTLTDMGGNTLELTAQLTVLPDTEPPVIYGAENKVIYLGETVSYLRGVSAWDNCDQSVEVKVDSSKVRIRQVGEYSVTYTATDRSGNVAEKTVTLSVREANFDSLNAIADEILQSILRDGMTEVQRARAIYDWVEANMSYTAYADKTDYVAAAFYGFRNKRGDCFVYYAMSRVLLTRAGFENLEIQRNIPNKPHFWNLVKVDGNWYHFDTCPHYAAHPLDAFLLTDREVREYSENHVADYYSFDASLYPATP